MKSNFWLWVLVGGLVLVCLALIDRSCGGAAALREAKAAYAALAEKTDAANTESRERIAALTKEVGQMTNTISQQDAEILARDATITRQKAQIALNVGQVAALRTEVQPVLDANPKVAELVASLDAGILLRDALIVEQQGQITTLTAQGIVKDQRFTAQVAISDEWKANYERENILRVQAEGLFKISERRVGMNKMITKVALGVAGAGILYGLLK